MLLQYCVRLLEEFEGRLDFKCNLREVIEVHTVHVSRNHFCLWKYSHSLSQVCTERRLIPGYPIDENRWSENQSINRYQSIKLVNWYRLVSFNRWPIDNHTKIVHRLASIGRGHRNRRHVRYLSDHPPFFRSPGDDSVFSAKIKNITRCMCTWIIHLSVIAFPCHNVYARHLGRGFTEYKVQSQRLSSLPFWGERPWSVHCKQEEGKTRERLF